MHMSSRRQTMLRFGGALAGLAAAAVGGAGRALALVDPGLVRQALAIAAPAREGAETLYAGAGLGGQSRTEATITIKAIQRLQTFVSAHPVLTSAERSGASLSHALDLARAGDAALIAAHDKYQALDTLLETWSHHAEDDAGLPRD
jgi:hypothetical protein